MIILFLALTGIFFSIFFSSSEIALLSANKLQINVWKKQKVRLSNIASNIINDREFYLFCILVGNNLANMLAASFLTITLLSINEIPKESIFIIIAFSILLFAEIIPKTIVREFSNVYLLIISPILYLFGFIIYPFYLVFDFFTSKSDSSIFSESKHDYARDDIQHIYKHVDKSIEIEDDQKEMLSNVFTLGENTAFDVMTPRTDLSAISINISFLFFERAL